MSCDCLSFRQLLDELVMRTTQLELDMALAQADIQALKNWREESDEDDATKGRIP